MKVRLSVPLIVAIDAFAWMVAVGVGSAVAGGVERGVAAVAIVAYGLFMGGYLWDRVRRGGR